jgi:zinc D-Ala-D-Ala carboxypeptidase
MDLSKHFTLAEMTFSRTAAAERIDNTPGGAERANLEALCRLVLDPLRDAAGAAITVTSGYRGPVLNRRINGEPKSQHLEGKAADIQPTTMTVLELFKTVVRLALPFDQVIYEAKNATSKWVHVSHNGAANRADIRVARFLPTGKVERYEKVTAQQALEMQEAVSRSAQRIQPLEYDEMNDEPGDDEEPKAAAKKSLVKEAPAKEAPVKKGPPKKTMAKQSVAKKVTPKKVTAKKVTAKKPAAKKTAMKKIATKKPTAKKPASRKSSKPAVAKKR